MPPVLRFSSGLALALNLVVVVATGAIAAEGGEGAGTLC